MRALRSTLLVLAALCGLYAVAYAVLRDTPRTSSADWRAAGEAVIHHRAGVADFAPPEASSPMAGELRRHVLALYNGAEQVKLIDDDGRPYTEPFGPHNSLVHRNAELPLNHLGLVVEHRDLDRPLPGPEEMARYVGVVVWVEGDRCRDPEGTLRWYAEQARAGRPVVLMERHGCQTNLIGRPVDPRVARASLETLGIALGDDEIFDADLIETLRTSGARTAFERPLDRRLEYWREVRATDAKAKVWLRLGHRGRSDRYADAVFTGAGGSFVLRGYALVEQHVGARRVRRWQIDPFAFFAEALGLPAGAPRLDFTTLNGSRLFYAHVDGDGMEQVSEIDRRRTCGEVVRDELLRGYDLPVTASVVVGMVRPPPHARGSERDVAVARSIFALPNVEVASHGYSHPLDWRAGRAPASVPDLPGYEMSGVGEIEKSAAYIDAALAPAGKPTRVMLWTGWCNPEPAHLEVAYGLGLYNLNGGDGRMDRLYPSYAHLAPPVRRVGGWLQFHSSAANDYILTDEWQPPYYRFANIVDTFENSGEPRRVLPANVYYHFYIGRKPASMAGVKAVYDWVRRRDLAPVFVSDYIDVVRDFMVGRVVPAGDRTWRVRVGRHLRTVRFEGEVHVDLERSRGVLGYLHAESVDATYVHLGQADATVALGDAPPSTPYLRQASHRVESWRVLPDGVRLTVRGVGRKKLRLGGVPDGDYALWVDGARVATLVAHDGALEAGFDGNGVIPVEMLRQGPAAIEPER